MGGFTKELKGEDAFDTLQVTVAGERLFFTLVADGHGGKDAVQRASKDLLPQIVKSLMADGSTESLHQAVVSNFYALHESVRASGSNSGSTLTVCCMNATRHELSMWNVGDSLGVLVDSQGHILIGTSHRLESNPEEQARVSAMGAKLGRVMTSAGVHGGPLRAWPGGLAVTRGIGDADCGSIVTPEPACTICSAPSQGGALISCSDGVWDHISPEIVAQIALAGHYDSATAAAQQVVRRAVKHGLTDDTTAVVVLFGPGDASSSGDGKAEVSNEDEDDDEAAASSFRVRSGSFLSRVGTSAETVEGASRDPVSRATGTHPRRLPPPRSRLPRCLPLASRPPATPWCAHPPNASMPLTYCWYRWHGCCVAVAHSIGQAAPVVTCAQCGGPGADQGRR